MFCKQILPFSFFFHFKAKEERYLSLSLISISLRLNEIDIVLITLQTLLLAMTINDRNSFSLLHYLSTFMFVELKIEQILK